MTKVTLPLELARREFANTKISLSLHTELTSEFLQHSKPQENSLFYPTLSTEL